MSAEFAPRQDKAPRPTLLRLPGNGGFLELRPSAQEPGRVEAHPVAKKDQERKVGAVPIEIFPHGKDEVAVYLDGKKYSGPVTKRRTDSGKDVHLIEVTKEGKGQPSLLAEMLGKKLPLEGVAKRARQTVERPPAEKKVSVPFAEGVPHGGIIRGENSPAEQAAHYILDEVRRANERTQAQRAQGEANLNNHHNNGNGKTKR